MFIRKEDLAVVSGGMCQNGTRLRDQWMGEVAPLQDEFPTGLLKPLNLRSLLLSRKRLERWFLPPGRRSLDRYLRFDRRQGDALDILTRGLLFPVTPAGQRYLEFAADLRQTHIGDAILLRQRTHGYGPYLFVEFQNRSSASIETFLPISLRFE